jgi:hypothetical protein
MKSARRAWPKDIQTDILCKSRRRCCLCVALANDRAEKVGQLAHIDKKRNNSTFDNGAFLCLPHHEEYDSRPSQSKGLTPDELRRYRDELYAQMKSEARHGNHDGAGRAFQRACQIADRLHEFSEREDSGELVRAAGMSGELLAEARRIGVFDVVRFPDLAPAFRIYEVPTGAPLQEGRRLLNSVVTTLARRDVSSLCGSPFRNEPPHPGQSYDWDWLRSALQSLAALIRSEAKRLQS